MKKQPLYTSGLLLLFLFLVLSLNSCTDISDNIPGTDEEDIEESYFSIHLNTHTSSGLRAEIQEIEPWEYHVNKVWILLYNDKDTLAYKYELDIQNYSNGNTVLQNFFNADKEVILENKSGTNSFQTVPKLVKKQAYKMAVLANPPVTLLTALAIEVGSPLTNLTSALDGRNRILNTEMFGGYKTNTSLFFMSNANGLISIPPSSLHSSMEAAQAAPVQVYLDRLLAKVAVEEHKNGLQIYPTGVILDKNRPVKWFLNGTNKSTYLIRRFARMADNTAENEANSPKGEGRRNIYAEDPNFALEQNSSDQFHIWQKNDQIFYSTWISEAHSDPTATTFQYVFENTMDVQTQSSTNANDFITKVVLEAYLIYPELLWNSKEPNNENDPNRSYYSCLLTNSANETNWRIFTHQQAAHWLDAGFPYLEEAGNENENEWINLLEKAIREVQKDHDNNISEAFNFRSSQLPGTTKELYSTYNRITYHPLGLNKYNIPVRHFGKKSGNTNAVENYGYYGVVRNNMYTVTISSITGPGIGIYDWDNRYISSEISITPWYKREQGVDLGYE